MALNLAQCLLNNNRLVNEKGNLKTPCQLCCPLNEIDEGFPQGTFKVLHCRECFGIFIIENDCLFIAVLAKFNATYAATAETSFVFMPSLCTPS